jgi:hypothetical protein
MTRIPQSTNAELVSFLMRAARQRIVLIKMTIMVPVPIPIHLVSVVMVLTRMGLVITLGAMEMMTGLMTTGYRILVKKDPLSGVSFTVKYMLL